MKYVNLFTRIGIRFPILFKRKERNNACNSWPYCKHESLCYLEPNAMHCTALPWRTD